MELLELGRRTARSIRPTGRCSGRRAAGELRQATARIEAVRQDLSRRTWKSLPTGVEWLLDNAWMARREERVAREELGRGLLRRVGGRVYLLAMAEPLAAAAPKMDREAIRDYLEGLQQEDALEERELSLFISALKGALCLRLAALCDDLVADPDREDLPGKLGEIFAGLRFLSTANLSPILEEASPVEGLLRQDPAGVYPAMDEETRASYRHQVCKLAKRYRISEREAASRALELSRQGTGEERHIGWFLFVRTLGEWKKGSSGALYVASIVLPALFVALWLGFLLDSLALILLLLLPISDLMKNLVDFLVVRTVPPRPVHRIALEEGIPPEGRTLCVIAGLLTGEESGDQYAALLERYRLANRDSGKELRFGLLADLPDRASPMGEAQRYWVERARAAVEALNGKYGDGFYLFFREPTFQKVDERYVGWERKRGALLELARFLRGRPSGIRMVEGDGRALKDTSYIITLDSDTALNVGTAREMTGAMLHPLNRPVVDPVRRVVIRGYGLLQPRIGVDLTSANRSRFSRIFAGQGGIDPYGGACSDVYHDLFDRGTYTGKGIFHVDTFLTCLDGRFPQNRILSHDLLEGAYLHAGLLEEVELSDGYPYKVSGYFSRLHRWIRGDWQLLPWLGRRVKTQSGAWEENPITSVDRWKLFDNLRRSLSPISTLVALLLGMCLSPPAFGTAAALAVISAWSNLLLTGADLALRGGVGMRRRYHATIIGGLGGMILQTLLQLLFLPWHAWVCVSAISTALWRSLVSGRKLLEWVTAAAAEGKKSGFCETLRTQWPAVAVGVFAIFFSRFPAGAAIGLVWTASPAFAWALSRPIRQGQAPPQEDRPFLIHQAALIWGYFRDWLREEDHWLPPDNVQEKPWLGPARRTSPTNIGMALLSCVAAVDLELTGKGQAMTLIAHILDTLEALPKWKGHLYNWYDTANCTPLYPKYVSTVDSGNMRGCLIALREALYQWGEGDLARRAERLSDGMDLSPLFDRERRLFAIGFDVEKGALTEGWYDLLASEARLASYLAISLGEVDPRHWRRLGRGLVGENNYCGMASWTGTMFEYFMPNLLLPSEEGSLMYESLSFCVYAQKRRGSKTKTPWGISESGFYAFDPGMAYRYKAHGVQALGLKRGLDQELVVAPYASFLALLLAPKSAGRNLRRLRDMGLEGTYGLYEAVDYTPGRLPSGEDWVVVRSFMVHHLGMSLIAVDNVLSNGIMQERFLKDCSMAAFRELLQEKVPVGAPVMRPGRQGGMERSRPDRQERLRRVGEGYDLARPACQLLSNGLVSALCTDSGNVRLVDDKGEIPLVTRFRERFAPAGVSFFFREKSGKFHSLTAAPFFDDGAYAWSAQDQTMTWTRRGKDFIAELSLKLPKGARGALWSVTVQGTVSGELVCYLEPALCKEEDYLAHPAYAKLSLISQCWDRGITFRRRPGQGEREAALAILWDRREATWETSREIALGRGGLRRLEQALLAPSAEGAGAVLDPCLLVRFPVETGQQTLRLALGFEDGEAKALETAEEALNLRDQNGGGLGPGRLPVPAADRIRAMELLSCLVFEEERKHSLPQSALWPYGVSGDLPICVVMPPEVGEELEQFPLLAHGFLKGRGFAFDLVCLLSEGGSYHRPQKSALMERLKGLGLEGELGLRGGIHVLEAPGPGEPSPWEDWAAVTMDPSGHWADTRKRTPVQPPLLPCRVEDGKPEWSFAPDGSFILELKGNLPPLGWSHLLVEPRFGWLTDETGCGHLWRENAREAPITPWNNDPLAIGGPEWFLLSWRGETHSLFADGDGCSVRVLYGLGWAEWEKAWGDDIVRTRAIVPWGEERRLLLIELTGTDGSGELRHITLGQGKSRFPVSERICLETDAQGTRPVSPETFEDRLKVTAERWEKMCRPLWIETPDRALNQYLNGWGLYQVIACRLLGRTSHYQNGGAYGFRDQLQDTLSLLPFDRNWAREQILRCCAHQFTEGDVQHWWHQVGEETARGVRTRISDDLLWLPYALSRYVETWGDDGLLNVQVDYLSDEPLKPGERERYSPARSSTESGTVYEHGLKAIRQAMNRGVGPHGLLLMGAGDWNDGMNEVGAGGRGESVWLTWFALVVLEGFVPLAKTREDRETVILCEAWADRLRKAARESWDGKWYLRGWYDNGEALGSADSGECQIDSIPQSWAVLAGERDERVDLALTSALERLFQRETGVVRLFDPPFDDGPARPGYIRGYPPGVRENGGQYTHAAVWLALAHFQRKKTEDGYEILEALLPQTHPTETYKAEPYVLAGDVYSHPDHMSRGGWSWYTGAAGWFYQTAIGGLLGLGVRDGQLTLDPALPKSWPGWSARWETAHGTIHINVQRGRVSRCLLDGLPAPLPKLEELSGEHCLELTLSDNEPPRPAS